MTKAIIGITVLGMVIILAPFAVAISWITGLGLLKCVFWMCVIKVIIVTYRIRVTMI